jgi:hypothetical protein
MKTIKTVKTTEYFNGIPAGSIIDVKREFSGHYFGIWSSQMGSWTVTIPKSKTV